MLLADHDEVARAVCRRVLEDDPRFDVCGEVADAPAAIAKALRRHPDVVLVDSELPGGAIQATWEITARLPHARVVVRTRAFDEDELHAAVQAGAFGYVVRSDDDARLPETLARVAAGEAAVPRAAVAHLLDDLRDHAPRRRATMIAGTSSPLTSREWEVFDLLCQGSSTADIAESLMVSRATVRSHIAGIVRKLRVQDRAAAVELCGRLG
ncbi:MAG: response regulator transcription factor [Gaiellaceae bacterium]